MRSLHPAWKRNRRIVLSGVVLATCGTILMATEPPQPLPISGDPAVAFTVEHESESSSIVPETGGTGVHGYVAASVGPDLIVGHVFGCAQLGRVGAIGSGTIGMSCWTTACTIGDEGTNWWGLPDTDHPMISVNMFRLSRADGSDRLMQLGQSWLKHGFGTENADDCGFGCDPSQGHFNLNAPGCSDTYAASQFVPCDMGPRSMMNPYTGAMPPSVELGLSPDCVPQGRETRSYLSNDHRDHDHTPISHRLQVKDVDLIPALNPGARYFVEGQYLVPHEFTSGTGNGTQHNNASYRRVNVSGGDACGSAFIFLEASETYTEQPAINAWTGASQTLIEPVPMVDGRGFLVYKVTNLGNVWRYEYALYNMNMDRAMGSLSIPRPAGAVLTNIGFYAPLNHAAEPHTENYTNTPWTFSTSGGAVTWSTDSFGVDPFANAVRFGTMYNFWFDANTPPQSTSATVGLFKTGGTVPATTLGPSASGFSDCNNNTIEDRCDLNCGAAGCSVPGCGTKTDCNANAVPDDCEPDCNGNQTADRCEIAANPSLDCDADAVLDECEPFEDCDNSGVRDDCEIFTNPSVDSNGNGEHDACEAETGTTIYVDDDGPGDPFPGSSMGSDPFENGSAAHPFDAIQEGINAAASGDIVLVLDGTYKGAGNSNLIFGGRVVTVRSRNGADQCVIDLEDSNPLAAVGGGEGPGTRFEGFHITNFRVGTPLIPAFSCFGGSPGISRCKFTGLGVAIGCFDNCQASISHCTFVGTTRAVDVRTSRPSLTNCLIQGGNTGVRAFNGNGSTGCIGSSSPRITNCTMTLAASGIQLALGAVAVVENTIVWGNTTSQITADGTSTALISYSDVQGGWAGIGNMDTNPLFVNSGAGDFRLGPGSPCLDAGNNAANELPIADLDEGPRRFDNPAASDIGAGTPPIVDIGAYEWSDCNNNQTDDGLETEQQPAIDCNGNHLPDECEPFLDCNNNTTRDSCDISQGQSDDCNGNDIPDSCDIIAGMSQDCDGNGVPNECDADCQPNGIPDGCDIAGASEDLNDNDIPDECELVAPEPDPSGIDKNRALSVSMPASAVAGPGSPTALRVTLVDLQHPVPANVPASHPKNFTAFDTSMNGVCTGGSHNGHHCHSDSDCRVCASGNGAGLPCTSDSQCRRCTNDIGIICSINSDCLAVGGNCGIAGVCPATGGTCTGVTACSAAGEANGCARWVGKPATFLESQDTPGFGSFRAARLQCTAFYHDWTAEGMFHIVGAEILPSSSYLLESLAQGCAGAEESCPFVSPQTVMVTARYGDIAAAYNPPAATTQPDVTDVTQLVNKFKNVTGALSKAVAQLQPNLPELNGDVSVSDIVQCVDAVKSYAYPFGGPCPCPSLAECEALPCPSGANDCMASALPGLGAEATCIKTCRGGPNNGDPCMTNSHCPGGICDKECVGGPNNGLPCNSANPDCPNGSGGFTTCTVVTNTAFCRDKCGRCTP